MSVTIYHVVHTSECALLPAIVAAAVRDQLHTGPVRHCCIFTDVKLSRAKRIAALTNSDHINYIHLRRLERTLEELHSPGTGKIIHYVHERTDYVPIGLSIPTCVVRTVDGLYRDESNGLRSTTSLHVHSQVNTNNLGRLFKSMSDPQLRERTRTSLGIKPNEVVMLPLTERFATLDTYPYLTAYSMLRVGGRDPVLLLHRSASSIGRAVRQYLEGYVARLLLTDDPLLSLLPAADVAISAADRHEPFAVSLAAFAGVPVVLPTADVSIAADSSSGIEHEERTTGTYIPKHASVASLAAACERAICQTDRNNCTRSNTDLHATSLHRFIDEFTRHIMLDCNLMASTPT